MEGTEGTEESLASVSVETSFPDESGPVGVYQSVADKVAPSVTATITQAIHARSCATDIIVVRSTSDQDSQEPNENHHLCNLTHDHLWFTVGG